MARGGRVRARAPLAVTHLVLAVLVRAVLVLAVLVPAAGCIGGGRGEAERAARAIPLGAFLGSDARGVAAVAEFEAWLGTPVRVGHTYLPGHEWRDLEGPDWVLEPWLAWRAARADRMLVLNVPMLAPNEDHLPDATVAGLLRAGAGGAYDEHFRILARRLVAGGGADTVVVLGWEFNGPTYASRCVPDPAAWRQYWRRIVAVMRAVPGAKLRFDFTPVRGEHAMAWPRCYPGDDVVDIVGLDSYDQEPGRTFDDYLAQPFGLRAHAAFAAAHGKPMSFPEWGLFDFGDNPDYVRRMHAWMGAHEVAYQTITDYCPHGVWWCQANPASADVYRELFGVSGTSRPPGR